MKTKYFFIYLMGLLYIVAGIYHFLEPEFYQQVMPPYLPFPKLIICRTGAIEIILGILVCVQKTRRLASIGIILFLIAVFPANIYMYQQGGQRYHTSDFILLMRLPLQFLLIAWASIYARIK